MLIDLGGDLEALVVIGALLVEHTILGGIAELPLRDLLQDRLMVAVPPLGRVLDLGDEIFEDEHFRGFEPAIEVNGRD